jgi:hypothetical protein
MNNKILLPILIVIVTAGIIGTYFWQTRPQSTTPLNLNSLAFTPTVTGCAETDKGMASRSLGGTTEQAPKIAVKGNQISYSRALNHLCCRKAEVSHKISGSAIDIYENWSGIGCRCQCFSEIKATLNNIPTGSYIISVYEQGTKPGSNEPLEQALIISQNIIIP